MSSAAKAGNTGCSGAVVRGDLMSSVATDRVLNTLCSKGTFDSRDEILESWAVSTLWMPFYLPGWSRGLISIISVHRRLEFLLPISQLLSFSGVL